MRPPRHPLAYSAAASFGFAAMAFSAKLASQRLPGSEIAFARFIVMLLPLLLVPALRRRALVVHRRDLLFYRGFFGGLAVLLYFVAIAHIPVGLATLLNYTSPIWSVIFASLFLGERANPRLLVPLSAALVGMALAAGAGGSSGHLFHFTIWELAAVGSSLLAGAAVAALRGARRTEGSWAIYGSFTLFGLLATGPFALASFKVPSALDLLLLLLVGGGAVAGQLLMTFAYRWVTNLQAGIMLELTVALTMGLGALFLGERLTTLQLVGAILTLGGVIGTFFVKAAPKEVI